MARVRISISLGAEDAERIREHAERAGMDVSAYLVNAAIRQIAETEVAEAGFARIDALIADVEIAAGHVEAPAESGGLTEQERIEVDEAMRLVFGPDEPASQHPGEVA